MRQRRFVLYAVAFAMAFLAMGTSARADIVNFGSAALTGTVWKVCGNWCNAQTAAPLSSLGGTDTCNGTTQSTAAVPVDFLALNASEDTFTASEIDFSTAAGTLGDFLTSGGATVTGSAGTTAVMSNGSGSAFDSGATNTDYSTVVEITDPSYTFLGGTTYTISHDDGVIMYVAGSPVISSPSPTVDVPSTWTPGSNVTGAVTIWYMATNGNPEVLQLTSNAVPDGGATLMLLGAALFGLETLRRKFRV